MIYNSSEQGLTEMRIGYCYFLLKIVDLLDTVFIVLKKKNSQLSTLHCYHHFMMASMVHRLFITAAGGGPSMVCALINSFVHVCMYSYYLMTTFNPATKTSVWKKRITQIQLVQSLLITKRQF